MAEVLITLAIIGIVAALTIPTVVRNYQKQQTIVKLKKVYNTLNQAIQMSTVENGNPKNWKYSGTGVTPTSFYSKYLSNYLKTNKIITATPEEIGIVYKKPNGKPSTGATKYIGREMRVFLTDGTLITFNLSSSNEAYFWVSLDGTKGINQFGRDVFFFALTKSSGHVAPAEIHFTDEEMISDYRGCAKTNTSVGYGCAAKIMRDGWQIKDDYPW